MATGSDIKYEKDKVYIGSLRPQVTARVLRSFLNDIVPISDAFVVTNRDTGKSLRYGFATLVNPNDMDKLLKLPQHERYLKGQPVIIKKAIKKEKEQPTVPITLINMRLISRNYDLTPERPSEPSLHILCDDMILYIFSFLTDKQLFGVERVCRRWQSLIYDKFSKVKRVYSRDLEKQKDSQLLTTNLLLKYIIVTGDHLEELLIMNRSFNEVIKTIGLHCKSLKKLQFISCNTFGLKCFQQIIPAISQLEEVRFELSTCLTDKILKIFLDHCPNLRCLSVESTGISGWSLKYLPSTLTELHFGGDNQFRHQDQTFQRLIENCPNLEILSLHEYCHGFSSSNRHLEVQKRLKELGEKCPAVKTLTLNLHSDIYINFLSTFKNLKELHIYALDGSVSPLSFFPDIPQIELLDLTALELSGTIDLSLLPNLKDLHMPAATPLSNYKGLLDHKTLEKVSAFQESNELDFFLNMIEKMPSLTQISFHDIKLTEEILPKIRKATRKRQNKIVIKFTFSQIEPIPKMPTDNFIIDDSETLKWNENDELLESDLSDYDYDDYDDFDDYDNFGFNHSDDSDYFANEEDFLFELLGIDGIEEIYGEMLHGFMQMEL